MRNPFRFLAPVVVAVCLAAQLRAQFPVVPEPAGNPTTPAKAVLGKILFWDEQLSSDWTTACGTCHTPEGGGADPRAASALSVHPGPDGVFGTADDIHGSRGIVACNEIGLLVNEGTFFPNTQVTRRKAPSAIGAAFAPELLWDGRVGGAFYDPATSVLVMPAGAALEAAATLPLLSNTEMACGYRTDGDIVARLMSAIPLRLARNLPIDIAQAIAAHPTYPDLFESAFGDAAVSTRRVALAIACYERALVADQTPWDAYRAGNASALTPSQVAGLNLFTGAANCAQCHAPPEFTDHSFANIGLRPIVEDPGRGDVTANAADAGVFRVPGLRNAGLRARFFHNGSRSTIASVVSFYAAGGSFHVNQDPRIVPLTLTAVQRAQLADFVGNALTDPRVAAALPPFDRPGLHSEIPGTAVPYGFGRPGSGGFTPTWAVPGPAFAGAEWFAIGVAHALGAADAFLAFSEVPGSGEIYGARTPLWLATDPFPTVLPLSLSGQDGLAGAGSASFVTPIPGGPALIGYTLYFQWFVVDPGDIDGVAVSSGMAITVF